MAAIVASLNQGIVIEFLAFDMGLFYFNGQGLKIDNNIHTHYRMVISNIMCSFSSIDKRT